MRKTTRRTTQQEDDEEDEFSHPVPWQKIESEGLDCDDALLLSPEEADRLLEQLEEEVVYSTGEEATVQVFGKVHGVPRQQATHGDAGLSYTYSGERRSARPWTPTVEYIRDVVTKTTGHTFNFVLVNRRSPHPPMWTLFHPGARSQVDGRDHMGEHRDDERELDPLSPVASVSLGAAPDRIFRHRDARGSRRRRQMEPVKLELAHGSVLLMNPPTNTLWYHGLPVRRNTAQPRVNLSFRRVLRVLSWTRAPSWEEEDGLMLALPGPGGHGGHGGPGGGLTAQATVGGSQMK
ncbi:DNA oxidative demethylase ALKBH2 [Liparis tanakae]|uniref:DNA oxidative demethylase ALKBH2 n=1 Tax=Liparis tanakae TaxID=230148 RepID=A0A4Z2E8B2_9TELE|nr:DNA oxidative demethylase ALKBH2 [Liparis tanakae]